MPRRCSADVDEHPVPGRKASRPEKRRPTARVGCDRLEGAPVDDALTVDERQRRPYRVGGECLDDVAGEVEPRGNLPDAVLERRPGYWLSAEPPHLSR